MIVINRATEPLFIKNILIKPNTRAVFNEDKNKDITVYMKDDRDNIQILTDEDNITVICNGYLTAKEVDLNSDTSTIAIMTKKKQRGGVCVV